MDTRGKTSEAVVLRARDYKDNDKILVLFTRDFGKISVLARGVRKKNSTLVASSQLFTYGTFTFSKGKGSLGTLSQGQVENSFGGVKENLDKIAYASYFAEMIDHVLAEEKPNEDLFILLVSTLMVLEKVDDPYNLCKFFELRLLAILGYNPVFHKCVKCGRELEVGQNVYLSPYVGGLVCENCKNTIANMHKISLGGVKALEQIRELELSKLMRLKISLPMRKEIDRVLDNYLNYYIEHSMKAKKALEEYIN